MKIRRIASDYELETVRSYKSLGRANRMYSSLGLRQIPKALHHLYNVPIRVQKRKNNNKPFDVEAEFHRRFGF